MLDLLYRRELAVIARLHGAWPLEHVYALYGREILAAAQNDHDLAARVLEEAELIKALLDHHKIPARSRRGGPFLLGYVAGRIQELQEDDPDPLELYLPNASTVRLAGACQLAIEWRLLKP
ncbi:hypothetical protein [Sphaerisporangium aureirubrum]|uniref:Uncharacterized protein n=1 Tax=Sphaerisporangium aureirubrum TaxID=1544736 RepID=A0ABW1NDY9_9ACTN